MSRVDADVVNVDMAAAAADKDLYMRGQRRAETVGDIKQREDSDEYTAAGPTLPDILRNLLTEDTLSSNR